MARKERSIETDVFGFKVEPNRINSRAKGSRNENRAAGVIEAWTGVPFTRVPRSGGLRWKDTANVCGDLVCEVQDFDFPFAIETKHLKLLTLPKKGGNLRRNSTFYTIWEQAKRDADRAKKIPLGMIRANGMPKDTYYVLINFLIGYPVVAYAPLQQFWIYRSEDFFKQDFGFVRSTLNNYRERVERIVN